MKNNTHTPISYRQWLAIAAIVAAGLLGAAAILRTEPARMADPHGQAESHGDAHGDEEEASAKGPHGGQLMTEGDFGLEIRLVEEGGQAFLRVWLYDKGQPLPPGAAQVAVTLTRPGGEEQRLALAPAGDALASAQPIAEPHAFEAAIEARTPKEPYLFSYSRQEGRVAMTDAQVQAAGIKVESAAPGPIRSSLQLPGEIRFNEDRTAHVVPRVAGVVESVSANLGQTVRRGQVLAVIGSAGVSDLRSELQAAQKRLAAARATHEREKRLWEEKISPLQDVQQAELALREAEIAVANANQKLQAIGAAPGSSGLNRFELRAPFDGTVVEKHIALGEAVREDASVFTLSDLSSVWAEVDVPAKDLAQVRVGARVTVRSTAFNETAGGAVAYVGPLLGEQTRTAKARILLPNPGGAWRPGLFVSAELVTGESAAAVTVDREAVQQLGDKSVVFLKVPGGFLPQPVEVGRSDGRRVEIVKGLPPGTPYAAAGSFVVKSEAGKASATHTH